MATTTITVTKSQSVSANKTAIITFNKVTIPQYYTLQSYRISINSNPGGLIVYKYNTDSSISTSTDYGASTAETNLGWTDGGYPKLTVKNKSTSTSYSISITITFTLHYVEHSLTLTQITPTNTGHVSVYVNGNSKGSLVREGMSITVNPGDKIKLNCLGNGGSSYYVFDHLSLSFTPSDYDNYEFTMPNQDINLYLYCSIGYHLTLSVLGGEGNTVAYNADHKGASDYIKNGDVVTIVPSPAEGYIYKDFRIVNPPTAEKLNKTQFIMPQASTNVYVTFTVKPNNVVGYYNGTEFVPCTVNYYDGTDFVECEPYYYDGTEWVPISTS